MTIETLQRVLSVIESIAQVADPDEKDALWMKVYMIAHSHAGHCGNSHNDWQAALPELEKEFINP